jgi:CDP-glucose 4,6-dehydratase
MVSLAHFRNHFEGKKVFLTGHTGFKGSWLLQILAMCKADIKGYSLAPQKEIDLYNQINGDRLCNSIIHDLRDADFFKKEVRKVTNKIF